ncbi:RagB/SusD family nutrient uptake outer membrane protein [Sphingobacterium sp. LRF_L2]|uniref:RagB/SusD family nutrient uptake outer membrane protein n=1 Tax=Sphingobacterium sp. LRF_L2 TaxID=3369421 RepID=UPI003F60D995
MKSKKIRYIVLAILTISLNSSCEKWLDVQPKSQIKANELFETEAGYKEALAGVYTILTDEALYGKELTYGMMGVLSHEWNSFSSQYNDEASYNYVGSYPRNRMEGVWSNMYKAISNTNMILENIDKENVFTGDNRAIIKGEALALRAFIHFDLLRCFGVSYATNPAQASIPYVTLYTSKQTKQYTVDEIVQYVIDDLKLAQELLQVDPILTGRSVTEYEDNGYLINRQLHLNYYAVEALLARIYLYKGDFANARIHAQHVVDAQKFRFTSQNEFINEYNPSGTEEHIFGLQINKLHQYAVNYLSQEGEGTIFSLTETMLASYYSSNTDDYRYRYLFRDGTAAEASKKYILKYSEPKTPSTTSELPYTFSYYRDKLALIKISEMYFILAECDNHDGISPLPNLNVVVRARGVAAITDIPDFRALMTNEFRKEFMAEGQLFYYYKRINQEYIQNADVNLVTTKSYTFPIPDSEYEAGNRTSNR